MAEGKGAKKSEDDLHHKAQQQRQDGKFRQAMVAAINAGHEAARPPAQASDMGDGRVLRAVRGQTFVPSASAIDTL